MFTMRSDLALRILTILRDGKSWKAGPLAEALKASQEHVSKVLQTLQRAGMIEGKRGPAGGYTRRADVPIPVLDVLSVMDGDPEEPKAPALRAAQSAARAILASQKV
jgi:DNA-binding IscR family transcriptional regulator